MMVPAATIYTFAISIASMMSIKQYVVALSIFLLACISNPCWGQLSATPSYHRLYVGAQLASHLYAVEFPSGSHSMVSPNPFLVMLGYQLSQRWAVQVGSLYRHRSFNTTGTGTTETGQPAVDTFSHQNWNIAIPLGLRYTLTRQSARRIQIDGVAGLSFASTRYFTRITNEVDGQLVAEYYRAQKATGTYLTGGVSGRLGFGKTRRVEAVLDLLVNRNIEQFSKGVYQYLDAPGGLTRAYGLGLRYRFL